MPSPVYATRPTRIDTGRLIQQHPIAEVAARYGIELRRSGSALSGRCPFHTDGGRANLFVYPYVIWNQWRGREQQPS
jgi:hypothetical protein